VFRFLLIFALVALTWLFVDARWQPQDRVLSLRVRSTEEIKEQAFERARNLGRDWVRTWADGQRTSPPVSAPAPRQAGTPGDQSRLGQTVNDRLRP
jgi:hypothetical protein